MGPVAETEQGGVQFRVMALNPDDAAGKSESNAEGHRQNHIQLNVHVRPERIGEPPCPNNERVQQYLRAGSPDMREVQAEQQMVQVRLVRLER